MLAFHIILASNNGTLGLVGLIGIFVFIIGWGWYCRRLKAAFHRNLAAAGFAAAVPTPVLVAQTYPWLQARRGASPPQSPGVLFLLGLKTGAGAPAANGMVRPLEPFQGFMLPASSRLTPEVMEMLRQTYRRNLLAATTLSDGTHFFLWMRAHNPRQLTKILTMLQDIQQKATA